MKLSDKYFVTVRYPGEAWQLFAYHTYMTDAVKQAKFIGSTRVCAVKVIRLLVEELYSGGLESENTWYGDAICMTCGREIGATLQLGGAYFDKDQGIAWCSKECQTKYTETKGG